MKTILLTLLLVSGASVVILQHVSARSNEVHRLYIEDQEDRGAAGDGRQALAGEQLILRDEARRKRVHQLLAADDLKTAEDFHDAAFIYQHGQTPSDYLLAHILATVAVQKGDSKSLWISAATLDRYLDSIGQPQIFGTQYHSKGSSQITQEPYDRELVPDSFRLVFCVPSIEQQKKNLLEFRSGRYPSGILAPGCSR